MMGILLSSFYFFMKALKFSASFGRMALSVLWCVLLSLFYASQSYWLQSLSVWFLIYLTSIIFILVLTKLKPDTVISAYVLSLGFSYAFLNIAAIIIFLLLSPLFRGEAPADLSIDVDKPFYLLLSMLTFALQLFLSFLFFRIRHFRNGFQFLLKGYAIIMALIVAGSVLGFVTLLNGASTHLDVYAFVTGIFTVCIGIYIWIKRGINKYKTKKVTASNEKILQAKVDELEQKLQKSDAVNENLRDANHSLNHRLMSAERGVLGLLEKHKAAFSTDVSEDFDITIAGIRRLSKEHAADVARVKHDVVLRSTNVTTIDDMFRVYAEKFSVAGIRFKLAVTGSIVYMTENVIGPGKLETMIGDHLKNALIAVTKSEMSFRSVMAAIGEAGDCYEFSVHDSGLPFDVETLIRLGEERVTTREADGGSGVGFMKTFETMRERGASMIIQESEGSVFTKSVTIRFDGKGQYTIETYRPGEFPPGERYTVIGH
jgi:signal transduction histidine kinase